MAKDWKDLVSEAFGPTASLQDEKYPVAFLPCCARFGLGVCAHDLAPDLLINIDAVARKLNRLVFFRCLRPCTFLVEWLPLFLITTVPDANGCDFWLLMMVARSKSPMTPVFVDCDIVEGEGELGLPVAGTTVKVNLQLNVQNGRLYKRMAEMSDGNVQVSSLEYDWQSLDTLKVVEVKSDISEHLRSSKAEKKEKDKEFELVRDWDKVKLPKTGKRPGRKPGGGDGDEESDGDVDMSLPLIGGDGDFFEADGSSSGGEAFEDPGPGPGLRSADGRGGVRSARGRGRGSARGRGGRGEPQLGEAGDSASDEGLDADEVLDLAHEAEQERDVLPVWDALSKNVTDSETGNTIGSIKGVHVGTKKECVAVYCRLHQCNPPMRRIAAAPTNEAILAWFRAGLQDCPAGKAGRNEHLRLFKTMCPLPGP